MELVEITPINPLISRCVIKVCYVGQDPNRNGSVITKEVATKMANSLPGSPIVGFYNETKEDFEEHNAVIEISGGDWKFKDTTKPYGFVDLNARVWFQKFIDDDVEHEYLCTEGYLWTGQYPEAKRVIEQGNNQSMELDENFTKGSWTFDDNLNYDFFIINEAVISKLCILGEDVEPCFEGARIEGFDKIQFSLDDGFKKKMFSLIEEMKSILTEGGNSMPADNEMLEDKVAEEPVAQEEEQQVSPEEEAPAAEEEQEAPAEEEQPGEEGADEPDEEVAEPAAEESEEPAAAEEPAPVAYVLEEIPEYVQLLADYAAAQETITSLQSQVEELTTQNIELNNYKLTIDREKKHNLINETFYMLSDDDKKDVLDNIDTYSLDEIEAKLSVICVRNKISFGLDNNQPQGPMTVDIDNAGQFESNTAPAWFQRARAVEKEMSN